MQYDGNYDERDHRPSHPEYNPAIEVLLRGRAGQGLSDNNEATPEQDFIASCNHEGRRRAITRLFESVYQSHYIRNASDLGQQYISLLRERDQSRKADQFTSWLLTINPPGRDEFEHGLFIKRINLFLNRVWVKAFYGRVEFGLHGKHPHFHVIIRKNKPFSQVLRETFSAFKDLGCTQASIDCKPVRTRDYQRVKDYIDKNRPSDVELRVKHNYPPYWSCESIYEEEEIDLDNDEEKIDLK